MNNRRWMYDIDNRKRDSKGNLLEGMHKDGANSIRYYKKGKLHRTDGPAVTTSTGKRQEWYINGKHHREDGPALIYANGSQE